MRLFGKPITMALDSTPQQVGTKDGFLQWGAEPAVFLFDLVAPCGLSPVP